MRERAGPLPGANSKAPGTEGRPVSARLRTLDAPAVVVLAGIAAAVHVGKLPPAVLALQQSMGISLVQAGFLLSLVQIGGMSLGLVAGLLADGAGLRRSMLTGLSLLTLAGLAGAGARGAVDLLVLRAVEGVGLLLVAVPAPSLLRRTVAPAHLARLLGIRGAHMPFGMALATLIGPLVIGLLGWRGWWVVAACGTAATALAVWYWIPADPRHAAAIAEQGGRARLASTLRAGRLVWPGAAPRARRWRHRHHGGLDPTVVVGPAGERPAAGRVGRRSGGRMATELGRDRALQRAWVLAGTTGGAAPEGAAGRFNPQSIRLIRQAGVRPPEQRSTPAKSRLDCTSWNSASRSSAHTASA